MKAGPPGAHCDSPTWDSPRHPAPRCCRMYGRSRDVIPADLQNSWLPSLHQQQRASDLHYCLQFEICHFSRAAACGHPILQMNGLCKISRQYVVWAWFVKHDVCCACYDRFAQLIASSCRQYPLNSFHLLYISYVVVCPSKMPDHAQFNKRAAVLLLVLLQAELVL